VVQQTGPVNFQNMRVEKSTIGSINTGTIHQLDVAIGQAHDAGAAPLAEAIKALAEAFVQSKDLDDSRKNEALEQLTLLTEQVRLPAAQRKSGLIRAALGALKDTATTVAGLLSVWEKAKPYLDQLLPP
jgi:hypothetical protein